MKYLQLLTAVTMCAAIAMSSVSCSKDEPKEPEVIYYTPNAEGMHITENFVGYGIYIEKTYLWVSHNAVLSWSHRYEADHPNMIGGMGGDFKYYPVSLDKVDQFITHYRVLEGEDNHVVDVITPTKEPIMEYIKEHKYEYIASSPFYSGDIFFNLISNEYFDDLERSNEKIYNDDEDLR